MKQLLSLCFLLLPLGSLAATAQEKLPPGAKVVRLEAQPPTLTLKHPYDYSQLLLTAQLASGERVDVTRMARLENAEEANQVRVSAAGQVRPRADGTTNLRFILEGQSLTIPVTVSGQKDRYAASFVRDVMPAMSKMGCNAGTCHGAAQGKNGFKLSLRGYDPLFDHQALTDDVQGRRFNRAAPDHSLMLLKTSGAVPHVGGVLMKPGEPYYELLKDWIANGVKLDLDAPRVASIDIFPKSPVVPLAGMKQQMAVIATYSDGKVRDVSAEAFIESSNVEVATVDRTGLVSAARRGEAAMLARYEGAYTATTMIVMGDRSGFEWQETPTFNYIDALVYEKLKQVKILPSDVCSDEDFLRRVHLDLIGLPPQPETVRAFLADSRSSRVKRNEMVDRLVGSPEYIDHWTNKWADLLQVNRKFLGDRGAEALRKWIHDAIASNMPYDEMVRAILTGSGSTLENPPAAYYKILRDPASAMENTTQLFLAVRFNCNKCHDHPFERWTQDQYYHLSAFLAQVGRKEDPKYKNQKIGGTAVEGQKALVEIISDEKSGDVKHERTNAVAQPVFPYQHQDVPPASLSRRSQLAHWLTSRENPYFAKSYVNRLWSYLLGVGIIEPVDDIRAGNPPSNPKLLQRLTDHFVASGFNVQEMMRTICKSRVYQHAVQTNKWNADDEINYSHALARRLPAEVLYDTIHRATGAVSRLPGLPDGIRAAQLLDSSVAVPSGFLDLFGKPPRESACECERSSGMMLGPVLNLVNGPVLADALKDPGNRLNKLVSSLKDDRKLVEEIYLATLCRLPTNPEIDAGVQALRRGETDFPQLVAEHDRRVAALKTYEEQLDAKQEAWEKDARNTGVWTILEFKDAKADGGTKLVRQSDGSYLASGPNPTPQNYVLTAETKLTNITGFRLEALPDAGLPSKGPGRATNGNFVVNEFKVTMAPANAENSKPRAVRFKGAQASFSQESFPVSNLIDNNSGTGWAIAPRLGTKQVAVLEANQPIGFADGTKLVFRLEQLFAGKDHNLGRFRISATTAKPPLPLDSLPENIVTILALDPEKRTPQQKEDLKRQFRGDDAELARLRKAVADYPKPSDPRLIGAQDLTWALMNSPAFLFNH